MYEKIKALMDERGLTAHDVAQATGLNDGSFTAWKQGIYKPSIDAVCKLAKYFDVPFEYFLEGREN